MLKIDVHPDVYAELEDSRSWYEERARNLGKEFLGEVDRAVNAVQRAPITGLFLAFILDYQAFTVVRPQFPIP